MSFKEAAVAINGITLSEAQAAALRVAVTSFRMELEDPRRRKALGPIGVLYDARLLEIERLLVRSG